MVASQDPQAPLVVVIGITGLQGGSVANALIDSAKPYRVVGLTRDVAKPSAQAFAAKGVKLHEVDIVVGNDAAVVKAFEGADILFAVTNFIELQDKTKELDQGKLIVDAAKAAGVKLFIWSSLESVEKTTNGRYTCEAFDAKAEVTQYLGESGVPYALVPGGQYISNFFGGLLKPQKQADGTYMLSTPVPSTTVVPILDVVHDYGTFVRTAIENPSLGAGSEILCGTLTTFDNLLAELSACTGQKFVYHQATREEWNATFAAFHIEHLADMFWNMLTFFADYGYFGTKDVNASLKAAGITPPTMKEIVQRQDKDVIL